MLRVGPAALGSAGTRKLPTQWIALARSRLRPSGCGSAPWSHRCHDADRSRSPTRTATVDRLSGGRLTLGVGIGGDRFAREFSKTGEQLDERARGQMLDEALEILTTAWSGEPVHHHGDHYTVDDIQFLPRPVQRPGVPVWIAGFPGNVKPMQRAARYDGFFPGQSRAPRSTRRDRCRHMPNCATERDGAVRHRRWPPRWRRSHAVRRGRGHVVAPGVRPRSAVAGRRAGPSPSRTLRTVSTASFGHTDFYDAELHLYNPHFRGSGGASGRSRARRRLRYRSDHT